MGLLSDFVVAHASDAVAIADAVDRARWPSLQSKGFTQLEVGLLHFVLTGEDPDAPVRPPKLVKNPFTGKDLPLTVSTAYLDGFACLVDRGEAWVHELPASLVEELAEEWDPAAVASAWAQFEELEGAGVVDLERVVVELRRLARLARSERKSLLLRTSL